MEGSLVASTELNLTRTAHRSLYLRLGSHALRSVFPLPSTMPSVQVTVTTETTTTESVQEEPGVTATTVSVAEVNTVKQYVSTYLCSAHAACDNPTCFSVY